MAERSPGFEHPEELLAASGGPRPLPAALRARLEAQLDEEAQDQAARAISPEVRDRLELSLRRPLRQRRARKWEGVLAVAGIAAAVAIVVGVVGPGLSHKDHILSVSNSYAVAGPARGAHRAKAVARPAALPSGNARNKRVAAPVPGRGHVRFGGANPLVSPAAPLAPVARPVIGSVSPRSGPPTGGNWVVVTGTDLATVSAVSFGGVSAPRLSIVSTDRLKALAPAHPVGVVTVVVVSPAGQSAPSPASSYRFEC